MNQLRVAENCCDRCRPLWRQWHNIMEGTLRNAGDRDNHPFRAVNIGLQCVTNLADKLMTPQDHALLAGIGIRTARTDGLRSKERLHALNIVDARVNQPSDQAGEHERAATHLIARILMNGVLAHFMQCEIRSAITARNRSYTPAVNALPPYRDVDGKAVVILFLSRFPLDGLIHPHYTNDQVLPFISQDLSGAERAALYAGLNCRKLTRDDVPPHEKVLIGQWGVIAAKPIAKGTCVGVHQGVLVPKEISDHRLFNHDFLISLRVDETGDDILLDGDGIISKINTLVDYDDKGHPCRQALSGYNVEMVSFSAFLADKREVAVIALFSTADIPAGVELRCNYHYRDEEIMRLNKIPGNQYLGW